MHFLHIIDPQRRQWWRRFRILNLLPQSGQNGTSWSLTQGTTDFSIAVIRQEGREHTQRKIFIQFIPQLVKLYEQIVWGKLIPTSYFSWLSVCSVKRCKLVEDKQYIQENCTFARKKKPTQASPTRKRNLGFLRDRSLNLFHTIPATFLFTSNAILIQVVLINDCQTCTNLSLLDMILTASNITASEPKWKYTIGRLRRMRSWKNHDKNIREKFSNVKDGENIQGNRWLLKHVEITSSAWKQCTETEIISTVQGQTKHSTQG